MTTFLMTEFLAGPPKDLGVETALGNTMGKRVENCVAPLRLEQEV